MVHDFFVFRSSEFDLIDDYFYGICSSGEDVFVKKGVKDDVS
jgi:hypothetical protein